MRASERAGADRAPTPFRRHPFLWCDGDSALLKPVMEACCIAFGVRVFIFFALRF